MCWQRLLSGVPATDPHLAVLPGERATAALPWVGVKGDQGENRGFEPSRQQ